MKIKTFYNAWNTSYKEMAPTSTTIQRMDRFNNTKFSLQGLNEDTLTEAARNAHSKELVYYVTILNKEVPINFIEINKDFFRVGFLNDDLVNYMSYDFHGVNPGKLFLQNVYYWDFDQKSEEKIKMTEYNFTLEGGLTIVERDYMINEQVISEAKNKIDVWPNWEDYPVFGRYENLIRKERIKLTFE
jgi:hypothetical protein